MIVFLLVFMIPSLISPSIVQNELIIWNVGQGSWATLVQNDSCDHFDTGGERAPAARIQNRCATKLNRLHYSHWDWDHVSFTSLIRKQSHKICLSERPAGESPKGRATLMNGISKCDTAETDIREIQFSNSTRIASPGRRAKAISPNEVSRVFVTEREVLPGDSIEKAERQWASKLPSKRLRVLILGHHGSRTSTSETLLQNLPHLRQAVASARKRRYGHPHPDVLARLKAHGVATLRTEDWGSIYFER